AYCSLHGAHSFSQADAFKSSGDLHDTLKVFSPNFGFARIVHDLAQRAERSRAPGGAGQQRVAHLLEGGTRLIGEANPNGIFAITQDDRRCCRLAFEESRRVDCDLIRREASPRSHRRVDLIRNRGSAYSVLYSVEYVHNSWNLPN